MVFNPLLMRFLLFFLMLLPAVALNAQECKYNINLRDTISGKAIRVLKPVSIWKNKPDGRELYFKGMMSDNVRYLDVQFINSAKFTISKGAMLLFTMADGSKRTLKAMDEKGKDSKKNGSKYSAVAIFALSNSERLAIIAGKPVSLTLALKEGKVEMPLNRKQAGKLVQLMQCMEW